MVAKTVETKIVFSAIDRVSQKMKQISGSFAPLEKKMRSLGQNFQSIGTRMTLGGGAGLYAGFQGLLKPAMDFEQAMAGVYKVLDPSEVGLTDKQFSDHIHSLVPVLKKGAIDIAGSFQAGAQAGITSFEELNKFAELNTRMMATFDMSMYESAVALKTFRAQTGDLKNAEELMDTVNMLAKSFNTTERSLTDFLQRSLGLGNIGGLVKESVAGVGAALINLGVAPDLASTAFEKMAGRLNLGTAAAKEQREAMAKLGLSTTQVAKDMQRDGAGTIMRVMQKIMTEVPKDQQYAMIKGLFGLEGIKPILGLMQSDKTMKDFQKAIAMSLDMGVAKGQSYQEWLRVTSTTAYRLSVAQDKFFSLRSKVGETLLPTFEKFINIFEKFVDGWENLSPKMKDNISNLIIMGGVLTAGGTAAGIFSFALGGILQIASPLVGGLKLVTNAVGSLAGKAGVFAKGSSLLFMSLEGLTSSRQHAVIRKTSSVWGNFFSSFAGLKQVMKGFLRFSIITGGLALGAYWLYKNWDKVIAGFSAFKDGFVQNQSLRDGLSQINSALEKFSDTSDDLQNSTSGWRKFGDVLGEVFGFIAKIIGGVIDGINWLSQSWVGRIVNSTMAGAATGFAVAGLPGAVVGGTVGAGYGIGTEAADYMSTRHGIVAAPHPEYKNISSIQQSSAALMRDGLNIKTQVNLNDNRNTVMTEVANRKGLAFKREDHTPVSPVFKKTGIQNISEQGF